MPHMTLVRKIGDGANASDTRRKAGDHAQVVLDMFEYLGADERIAGEAGIKLLSVGIAHDKPSLRSRLLRQGNGRCAEIDSGIFPQALIE